MAVPWYPGFPGGTVVMNSPASARDTGSIPESSRSPGVGNGNLPGEFHGLRSLVGLWPHGLQYTRLLCSSPSPRACSSSFPLSQWCHPTMSSSVVPFSCCLQSFPASGSFPMSQLFTSGSQSIGVSASASVLQMNIQDWFPSGWTSWISLQSKGVSRGFSNTTVQKHQFFCTQLSL